MTDPFVLFESLRAGDVHAVRRAVEADPSLANARDEHGVSLLMLAMYHRHQDLAQEIAGRVDQLDAFEVAARPPVAERSITRRAVPSLCGLPICE